MSSRYKIYFRNIHDIDRNQSAYLSIIYPLNNKN